MRPWELLLLHSTVASCWGLWPAWGGCCSASHGTGVLYIQLWIHHFPPQSCSRAQSELCLGQEAEGSWEGLWQLL